jgi:1,4-alpha-glucan branching enzyme
VQSLVRDLNQIYRSTPALYEVDFSHEGFEWIEWEDRENSVFSWLRRDQHGGLVICISNFTPVVRQDYRIGVPENNCFEEILNSDRQEYGGSGLLNSGPIQSEPVASHGRSDSLLVTLPPLATIFLKANN